jgi:succinate dehydrogenase / fumarate reductase, membrane anchor subunit
MSAENISTPAPMISSPRPTRVNPPSNFETKAWMMMRYSAILLIPLAFGHLILQDVVVGVHNIDINYVNMRWDLLGWRIYDAALLAFAFAHGMNGFRQVLKDYIHNEQIFRIVSWILLIGWLVITVIGAVALIGGVHR